MAATEARESCQSFGDYMDAVRDRGVNCEDGEAGVLVWTPDQNTPDEVFYQVCVCVCVCVGGGGGGGGG